MVRSRPISCLMTFCFLLVQLVWLPQAHASVVSASSIIAASERTEQQARVADLLQRDAVAEVLERQGVTADQLNSRLDRLTDTELTMLAEKIDSLPAGEGALGLVLVVFLVLILLDVLGVTNIFPAIKSAN
jgi:hypothetical protein